MTIRERAEMLECLLRQLHKRHSKLVDKERQSCGPCASEIQATIAEMVEKIGMNGLPRDVLNNLGICAAHHDWLDSDCDFCGCLLGDGENCDPISMKEYLKRAEKHWK